MSHQDKCACLMAGAAMAMALSAAVPVHAQEGQVQPVSVDMPAPGEIIVTAQRRAQALQTVPIAITAIQSDTLQSQGVTSLANLAAIAPSLNVVAYPNSSDTLAFAMRGQGNNDPGQITRDGGVGVYIDGFYIARPQGALLDLGEPERIEVLRGPQGTLYGRNTTGGAVNIITRQPTGEWGGSASLSFGSRNLVRALGSVDLPSFGNLAIKGTISYKSKDGWVKNPGAQLNFGEFGQIAGRIAAEWKPVDDFTVRYAFDLGRVRSTPPYYVNPALVGAIPGYSADRDRTYAPLDLDYSVTKFVDHQLTLEYQLSDAVLLRSLSAYRGTRATQDVNYGVAQSTPFFPLTVESQHYYRTKQYTQEFQLIGDITSRLDFTGGLYYFKESGYHPFDTTLGYLLFGTEQLTQTVIHAKSESYAAYAQSTWTPPVFDDRIKLTVGGRYTRDLRDASRDRTINGALVDDNITNSQRFNNFSPMANLAVQWTPQMMTYFRFSKAYKAGGSSELSKDFTQTFGPEKITAYEVGLKSQLFDRLLTFNVAAFLNKFDDLQIIFGADPVDTSIIASANAGKAEIKGVEIDATLQPSPDFSLRASYGYLKSDLKQVVALPGTIFDPAVNPSSPFNVGDNVAGYFTLPYVPKHSLTLSGDWTFLRAGDDAFAVHGAYTYQSAVFTSAGAGPLVPGHELYTNQATKNVNARLTWTRPIPAGKQLRVSLFAENLFNNRRRSDFTIGVGGTAFDGFQSFTTPYNEPRTIGGEVRVEF